MLRSEEEGKSVKVKNGVTECLGQQGKYFKQDPPDKVNVWTETWRIRSLPGTRAGHSITRDLQWKGPEDNKHFVGSRMRAG